MTNNSKIEELKKRILFTFLLLGVYRVATQVPTPGVNALALSTFFSGMKGSIFGVFNTFSGGALERFSVLALGIMPYITSSIIFSLLTVSFPALAELQKEAGGSKKISQYTRYLTVLLCIIQGYGLAAGLEAVKGSNGIPVVIDPGWNFRALTIVTLTAGTMFVMWLGEQITERGIGNGISLIIFAGIASGIPQGIKDTLNLFQNGELTGLNLLIVISIMLATFWVIIYIEKAVRKIPVQYAKRIVNNRMFGGQSTHLPIKINISGVMPPIFASAILGFPTTIAKFVPETSSLKQYFNILEQSMIPGSIFYNVVFVGMIVFFAYFYSSIQLKTDELAENLRKNGGFIPGIRPGEKTVEFLDFVINRLTLIGSIYISLICVMPSMLFSVANVPFYFGGTSLLILVGVAIDTLAQVEGFMISQKYDSAYKVRGKYTAARRF